MRKYLNLRPNIALGVIFAFLANTFGPMPSAQADEFRLPAPGVMVHLSPEFNPPILKGIKVHPDNPFRFDFILDQGDENNRHPEHSEGSQQEQLRTEATKLIKYFLASLTIPEKDLWVNLSPYEKNRIVPESFGQTEMGRDLLAEDYMLKQITASLIYPEDETGKKFWKRIYEEANKKFGTTNIPVNTFNKVWIVPDKAVVYENAKAGTAYVVESKLKVMLEQDYLALQKHTAVRNDMASAGANIVREVVIPELTKEINEGKNFAQLRQVYNSLILATWYKKKIKDSILGQVYTNKNKTAGVQYISTVNDVEAIYQRYLQAFKKGVYNYIKEETDPVTQQTMPRKYFSGGEDMTDLGDMAMAIISDKSRLPPQEDQLELEVNIGLVQGKNEIFWGDIRKQTDPNSAVYKLWNDGVAASIWNQDREIQTISGQKGLSALEVYLSEYQNKEPLRVVHAIQSAFEQNRQIIVELGSGNMANALELARKNPKALILATDRFDTNSQTTAPEYLSYAVDFEKRRLPAQQAKDRGDVNNLEIVRSFADILLYLPDNSVDSLVIVQPSIGIMKDFIVLVKRFEILKKLKSNVRIASVANNDIKPFLDLIADKVNFEKQPDTIFAGVDLGKNSKWQKGYLRGSLYVGVKTDSAMTVLERPHYIRTVSRVLRNQTTKAVSSISEIFGIPLTKKEQYDVRAKIRRNQTIKAVLLKESVINNPSIAEGKSVEITLTADMGVIPAAYLGKTVTLGSSAGLLLENPSSNLEGLSQKGWDNVNVKTNGFFLINVQGLYLLTFNHGAYKEGKLLLSPPGGGYRFTENGEALYKQSGIFPMLPVKNDQHPLEMHRKILGEKLNDFVELFNNGTGRELTPLRELREELVGPDSEVGIFDEVPESWRDVKDNAMAGRRDLITQQEHNERVIRAFNAIQGIPKVVDMGSGDGEFSKNYREQHPHEAIIGYELRPHVKYDKEWQVQGDARETGLLSGSVDKVTINMPESGAVMNGRINSFIKEAKRILKPTGEINITFEIYEAPCESIILKSLKDQGFNIEQAGGSLSKVPSGYPRTSLMLYLEKKKGVHFFRASKDAAMVARPIGVVTRGGRQLRQWARELKLRGITQVDETQPEIGKRFNVSAPTVSQILGPLGIKTAGAKPEGAEQLRLWAGRHKGQWIDVTAEELMEIFGLATGDTVNAILKRYRVKIIGPESKASMILHQWAKDRTGQKIETNQEEIANVLGLSPSRVNDILKMYNVKAIVGKQLGGTRLLEEKARQYANSTRNITTVKLAQYYGVSRRTVDRVLGMNNVKTSGMSGSGQPQEWVFDDIQPKDPLASLKNLAYTYSWKGNETERWPLNVTAGRQWEIYRSVLTDIEQLQEAGRTKKNLGKITREIMRLRFCGVFLFDYRSTVVLAKQERLLDRLKFFPDLLGVKDDQGKVFFAPFEIVRIMRGYTLGTEKDILAQIDWLRRESKVSFNGRQVRQIVLSRNQWEDKKGLIDFLRSLKFNGFEIALIITKSGDAATKRMFIEYLGNLKKNGELLFSIPAIAGIVSNPWSWKEKRDMIEYFLKYRTEDGEALLDGSDIRSAIRQHTLFKPRMFESILRLFQKTGIDNKKALNWTLHSERYKQLLKGWADNDYKGMPDRSRRSMRSLFTRTKFDREHLRSLINILFEANEAGALWSAILKKERRVADLWRQIAVRPLIEGDDNILVKEISLSPDREIRDQLQGRIYAYLADALVKATRKFGDDGLRAFHYQVDHYDWTRLGAGLKNLRLNMEGNMQEERIKRYLYRLDLPEHVQKILKSIRYLKKKGKSAQEAEEYLQHKYSYYQVMEAQNFFVDSLDRDLSKGEGKNFTLHDLIAAEPSFPDDVLQGINGGGSMVTVNVGGEWSMVEAETVGDALEAYWDERGDGEEQEQGIMKAIKENRIDIRINDLQINTAEFSLILDKQLKDGDEILITITEEANGNGAEKGPAKQDPAMSASPEGGIDLSKVKIDSRLRGNDNTLGNDRGSNENDKGIQFHLDPAMLQQLKNAPGFVPVIINIRPMTDLRVFLGINGSVGVDKST